MLLVRVLLLFVVHYHSLKTAVRTGNNAEVQRLLSETAVDVNVIETDGSTILHYAAKVKCNENILSQLLQAGALASVAVKGQVNARPALREAAMSGGLDFIKVLLSKHTVEQRQALVNDRDAKHGV